MSEIAKAHVNRYGPSSRGKQMPGLGQSKEAITAVFEELQPNNLAKQIYEADGAYIVVQLIARSQANVADFDKDADRRVAELRATRGQEFLEEWMKNKCETLAKDGKIRPQQELLIEHDDQGKLLPIGYKPCMSFR
jgi:ribosome biogenesis SPOUT family RNA methylase Rps3